MNNESPSRQLFRLIWPAGLAAQAIHVVAKLGVADRLDDGPRRLEDFALEVDARPEPLRRVLRVLTSVGVFAEDAEGLISHTPLSETLRSDHVEPTREWAIFLGSEWIWKPWGKLYDTVRTGEPPFEQIFGQTFYEYLAERPEEAAIFDGAMSAGAATIVESVVAAFDFSPYETIVDVGGGEGQLLKGILTANPMTTR